MHFLRSSARGVGWLASLLALGLATASACLIVGLMALVASEVVARAAFNIPFRGTAELASLCIVIIVFLGLPHVAGQGRLIRSDLFLQIVSRRAPRLADLADRGFDFVSALFLAAVAMAVWPKLVRAVELGSFIGNTGDFTFPLWPKLGAIVLGAGLAAIILALRSVARDRAGGDDGT